MLKRIVYFFIMVVLVLSFQNVEALSVSKNKIEMTKGSNDTIDLYVNLENSVNEVDFSLVYTSYDVPAYFSVNKNYKLTSEGITNKVKFNDYLSGKIKIGTINIKVVDSPKVTEAYVNLSSAYAFDGNHNKIKLNSQGITVKIVDNNEIINNDENNILVNEEPENGDRQSLLLKEIKSNIVNVSLKENIYNYQVNIKENIKELDLEAIPFDSKAKVEISNQKISELQNNEIKIKVSLGNEEQVYTIKVKQNVKEEIKIDNSEIKVDKGYKLKWIVLVILLIVILFSILFFNKMFY